MLSARISLLYNVFFCPIGTIMLFQIIKLFLVASNFQKNEVVSIQLDKQIYILTELELRINVKIYLCCNC